MCVCIQHYEYDYLIYEVGNFQLSDYKIQDQHWFLLIKTKL